jgi:hypothetical protein
MGDNPVGLEFCMQILNPSRVHYNIERYSMGYVEGWAYDRENPSSALMLLAATRDTRILGATMTGGARPDVEQTTGVPNTGFRLGFPANNFHEFVILASPSHASILNLDQCGALFERDLSFDARWRGYEPPPGLTWGVLLESQSFSMFWSITWIYKAR